MVTSHRRQAWDHTAALMALLAEINRNPKKRKRPFGADDFHPLPDKRRRKRQARDGITVTPETIPILAKAIVGRPRD